MKKIILFLAICMLFSAGCTMDTQARQINSKQIQKNEEKFATKEYSFISDGKKIYARALIPVVKNNAKLPLAIYSHGFGGNSETLRTLQEDLVGEGVAVFAFDFAGGSGNFGGKSEGKTTDMSVLTEVQNLKDAIEFAKKLDFVDKNRIYLIGSSQGGVVSTIVADELKQNIVGLYLIYPAFSLFDDTRLRFPSKDKITPTSDLMGITVGRKYFADVHDIDIYDVIKRVKTKTYIFHGNADSIVPVSYSQRALKSFPNAKLTTFDNVGHSFGTEVQKKAARTILEEMKNTTTAKNTGNIAVQIDNSDIDVKWTDAKAVSEIKQRLKQGEITVKMSKYGGYEQVGNLGNSYSSDDKRITTDTGDIVLYSKDKIVIFYGKNTWEYTKLGKIENMDKEKIRKLLSEKDVVLKLKLD